jgi:hypothetical protein
VAIKCATITPGMSTDVLQLNIFFTSVFILLSVDLCSLQMKAVSRNLA